MSKRPPLYSSAAFTLIEVLLSLAIAGVVMVLAYSLFHGTNTTLRGQQERDQVDRKVREAYLQFEQDLMNAVPSQGYPEREFLLTEKEDGFVDLEFAFMQRIPGEEEVHWAELRLVRYFVNGAGALIRESRSHLNIDDLQSEVLIKECGLFSVTPTSEIPGALLDLEELGGELPGGVEITLADANDPERSITSRVLIPAGQKIMRSRDDTLDKEPSLLRGLPGIP